MQLGLLASSLLGFAFSLSRVRNRNPLAGATEEEKRQFIRLIKKQPGFSGLKRKTKAVSKRLHKYVDPCMKRHNNPSYCWRVAWNIYCSNVDPKYPGCTKYGRKWGKPYSRPLSRKRLTRKRTRR